MTAAELDNKLNELMALSAETERVEFKEAKKNMDPMTPQVSREWVQYLPDGAVSIDIEDATLVLRASKKLQKRFETLLVRRKAGTLSPEKIREYESICDLDTALSWLNRLARGALNC